MRALHWLILLLMVPLASGQVASWDDPEDDMTLQYVVVTGDSEVANDVPNPAGWYPDYDLVRAGIWEETEDSIVFEMVPASMDRQGSEPQQMFTTEYDLYFSFHDEPRRLHIEQWHIGGFDIDPFTYLQHLEQDQWQYDFFIRSEDHPDGTGWTFQVPKWYLRDSQNIPARAGDVLGAVWAESHAAEYERGILGFGCVAASGTESDLDAEGCGFRPHDLAGSSSAPLGSYEVQVTPEGLGHILMEIANPLRASNGLATTYVYEIQVRNLDPEPDTLTLQVGNVPSGWDVYAPTRIELAGEEAKTVRVAVSVPFGHKHGEEQEVLIRGVSARDPETLTGVGLYVWWPEIAQPSGHHSTLFLHSDGWFDWINTAQDDDWEDESGTAEASSTSNSWVNANDPSSPQVMHSWAQWQMGLRPSLFTGLDFETDQSVAGTIAMESAHTWPAAQVDFSLVLYRSDADPIVVAEQSQTMAITAGTPFDVTIDAPVSPEVDRVPYDRFMTLSLELRIEGDTDPAGEGTYFATFLPSVGDADEQIQNVVIYTDASSLELPLLDYHEDVDPGLLDALTRLQLLAPEDVYRATNPGKTLAFEFVVENKGKKADTVEWSIEGPMADWAKVVPGLSSVAAGKNATVAVRVDVPSDAIADDVADLLLVGQSVNDPEAQVFGHFVAYVTDDEDVPDEAESFQDLQGEAKKSEAKGAPLPLPLAFLAVAVALVARRR